MKLFPPPDPEVAAEMYEFASEMLSEAGYYQYEISNWAKFNTKLESKIKPRLKQVAAKAKPNNWECRHNLQYWRNLPYFGFGAGAHGFIMGYRVSNVLSPKTYIKQLTMNKPRSDYPVTPATADIYPIDISTAMSDTMIMGLRLTNEGVSRKQFKSRFQLDYYDVFRDQIDKLLAWGLVEWFGDENDIVRLTSRGRLLGNRVFSEFV
jgi:oxygen-independent coproporphyrinogen-3 oxidase